jgi:lipopolysaccharide transport system permease protein
MKTLRESEVLSAASPPPLPGPVRLVIRPIKGWAPIRLREIWDCRELLYFLVWRDIKVRYKQTVLGAAWAVLQPLLTMVVFSIFFGGLGGMPSDGLPYPIFAYTALLPWQLFSHALTESSNSLVANQNLITKVYFPRLVIPIAPVLAGLVDFCIASVILFALMIWYGLVPSIAVVALPLFIVLVLASAVGVGFWLSALNVQYRDVRYTIPFMTQLWLLLTPVAYPASMVPEAWRGLYSLNPMVGVVEGFRWVLLGSDQPPWSMLIISSSVVILICVGGLYYFRRMEQTFADVV